MMTWQGTASPRLESVRLLVSDGRLRASGRVVAAASPTAEAYSASFEFSVARTGDVGRGLLRTITAEEERQISVGRTEDGVWLIDHGQGADRNEFDGAADVDVAGLVTFTSLPIRRLGLHRQAGEHELPVLYVSMPDLSVPPVAPDLPHGVDHRRRRGHQLHGPRLQRRPHGRPRRPGHRLPGHRHPRVAVHSPRSCPRGALTSLFARSSR